MSRDERRGSGCSGPAPSSVRRRVLPSGCQGVARSARSPESSSSDRRGPPPAYPPRMRGRVGRGSGRTLQRPPALGDPISKALEPPFGHRRSAAAPLRTLRGRRLCARGRRPRRADSRFLGLTRLDDRLRGGSRQRDGLRRFLHIGAAIAVVRGRDRRAGRSQIVAWQRIRQLFRRIGRALGRRVDFLAGFRARRRRKRLTARTARSLCLDLRMASSSASRSRVMSGSLNAGSTPRNCARSAVRARSYNARRASPVLLSSPETPWRSMDSNRPSVLRAARAGGAHPITFRRIAHEDCVLSFRTC